MSMDFANIFTVFLNFISNWCIGIHWSIRWGSSTYEFYPFVYLCCVVITDLVFDIYFPRPKGDD